MSSPYKKSLDEMIWSYSRVNSYANCPFGWKLHYLDHVPGLGSSFAEWGSLCHSLFEDYAKGELAEYELGGEYDARYEKYMQDDFPPARGKPLSEKYYERGKELFSTFEGFPDDWEILGSEMQVSLKIDKYTFTGYIDLLVRSKSSGRLIVVDHKSKSGFKDKDEESHYALQLYLYARWVYEKFGEYPEKLIFNMFRVGTTVELEFDEEQLAKAREWFLTTIESIYQDTEFKDKIEIEYASKNKSLDDYGCNDFFCNYLCDSRTRCPRSMFYDIDGGKNNEED